MNCNSPGRAAAGFFPGRLSCPPRVGENPGVLATNPLVPFSVVRQLFKVPSFLVTAEDAYQPAGGRQLCLSFPICKMMRLPCGN